MKSVIFDLDGTLIDTSYGHTSAWYLVFQENNWNVDAYKIHRRIGMCGDLFIKLFATETNHQIDSVGIKNLQKRHAEIFSELFPIRKPLTGAVELLKFLRTNNIKHGIATSGSRPLIDNSLEAIQIQHDTILVEGRDVAKAKPEPDIFLKCLDKLNVKASDCYVVGDAVWDIFAGVRAGMLCIGLLTGGNTEEQLLRAGAYRVFKDPEELHHSLSELGIY